MDNPLSFLFSGTVLGLSAGVSPGPLLTLVILETLAHSVRAGARVALAPLVTDAPIIAASLLALGGVSRFEPMLGAITLAGGLYLLYLAWESFAPQAVRSLESAERPRSLRKGVAVNFLSPAPYLFWFTVGGPMLLKGWSSGLASPVLFVVGFYGGVVGSKMTVAWLTGRFRGFLHGPAYRLVRQALGLALAVFAVFLFREGFLLLGFIRPSP